MKIKIILLILLCFIILSTIVYGYTNNMGSNLRILDTLELSKESKAITNYQVIHDDINSITCYCASEHGYGRSSVYMQCFLDSQINNNKI